MKKEQIVEYFYKAYAYVKVESTTSHLIKSMDTNNQQQGGPKESYLSRRDFIKAAGVVAGSLALAACANNDVNAPVDIVTPKPFDVDPNRLYPEKSLFKNKEFFGTNTKIREFTEVEIKPYTDSMAKAANKMGWYDDNMQVEYDGIAYVDQTGLEVPIIIAFVTPIIDGKLADIKQMYMYAPFSETDQSFVPATQTPVDSEGRFFQIYYFEDSKNGDAYFGLGKLTDSITAEMTIPLFKVVTAEDGTKTVIAYEPYSMSALTIDKPFDAPEGAKKVFASLVSVEAPAASQLPPEMTEEYLNDFKTTEDGIKQINGKDTNVIYGVKEDGTKLVIAMEIETDREMRMTRVGEYTDEAGFSYYVMMDKTPKIDGSMGGRFNVTDDTAKKLFKIDTEKGAVNIWKSLGRQWGISPEAARDKVMIDNNGIAHFDVAVGIPTSNAKYPSKSESLPYPVNFNLPIKVNAIATVEDYNDLPDEIKRLLIVDLGLYKDSGGSIDAKNGDLLGGGSIFGSLIWASPDGQLTIYSVSTAIEHFKVLTPEKMDKDKTQFVNSYLKECINTMVGLSLDMLSKPNGDIPSVSFKSLYYTQLLNLFEVDGFINNSSQ